MIIVVLATAMMIAMLIATAVALHHESNREMKFSVAKDTPRFPLA